MLVSFGSVAAGAGVPVQGHLASVFIDVSALVSRAADRPRHVSHRPQRENEPAFTGPPRPFVSVNVLQPSMGVTCFSVSCRQRPQTLFKSCTELVKETTTARKALSGNPPSA